MIRPLACELAYAVGVALKRPIKKKKKKETVLSFVSLRKERRGQDTTIKRMTQPLRIRQKLFRTK